ncbi:hypothetical protein HDV04_000796, partial [Boothiomyces sp. JEL0838]
LLAGIELLELAGQSQTNTAGIDEQFKTMPETPLANTDFNTKALDVVECDNQQLLN